MLIKLYEILILGAFLAFLMLENIVLGKKIADIKKEYNAEIFKEGIFKAVNIGVFIIGTYIFANLPFISTITIINPVTAKEMLIADTIKWLMYIAIPAYFIIDLIKVIKYFKLEVTIKENDVSMEEIVDTETEDTNYNLEYAGDEVIAENTDAKEGV